MNARDRLRTAALLLGLLAIPVTGRADPPCDAEGREACLPGARHCARVFQICRNRPARTDIYVAGSADHPLWSYPAAVEHPAVAADGSLVEGPDSISAEDIASNAVVLRIHRQGVAAPVELRVRDLFAGDAILTQGPFYFEIGVDRGVVRVKALGNWPWHAVYPRTSPPSASPTSAASSSPSPSRRTPPRR